MTSKSKRSTALQRPGPEAGEVPPIGPQMKRLRRDRNLTLDVLAEKTGLNKSHLSRLERGEKSPSVATVVKLAQALKVPVATFFGETIDDNAIHMVRAKSRRMIKASPEHGSYPFATLSKPGDHNRVESFVMVPPEVFNDEGFINHAGEEVFYVLEGKVEISFADRSVAMSQGDYLQFPGHLQHQVRRLSDKALVLIVILQD